MMHYFMMASTVNVELLIAPITRLVSSVVPALLSIYIAYLGIEAVVCGFKMSRSTDPQEQMQAKTKLRHLLVGFFLTFSLILAFRVLGPELSKWLQNNT